MPSLTAGVEPLETEADTNRAPWELAVLFDESDAVGERETLSRVEHLRRWRAGGVLMRVDGV